MDRVRHEAPARGTREGMLRALLVPSLTHLLGDRAWWPFGAKPIRRGRETVD